VSAPVAIGEDAVGLASDELLAEIAEGAAASDASGHLVACHDLMLEAGLFHVLVPRELDGAGGTAVDWFDTAVAVAHADPAAGWVMAQGAAQNAWIAVAGSPELAATFFRERRTIATSSAGAATAERRGDHLVVSGSRWGYVSGCEGAAHLGGMVRTTSAAGAPEGRMVLVPAAGAAISPTWDTLGLRGTGSHHVEIPEGTAIPLADSFTWPNLTIVRPGPLANAIEQSVWLITVSAAAVNLGAARRAIAEATAAATHKLHRFDTVPVIEQPPFVRGVAELHGQVDLAQAGLRALLDQLWEAALRDERPGLEQRARLRLAAIAAVRTGADVVRAAQGLTGADALHRGHPLERIGRDAQMLLHHVATSPSSAELLGTVLLGTFRGLPGSV